ncbi:MAG: MotA/TolQ/ExbB proton channel family protein [Deltaproteobacteria bacterium]|nr:MotA/TolQ/ExbB proton channel family protein [Deltaproteobacteria bacterium]
MLDYFFKGGFTMYPLLALSIASLAVIVERVLALRRASTDTEAFMAEVARAIEAEQYEQALETAQKGTGVMARILAAGIEKARKGKAEVEKAIEGRGNIEIGKLERGIPFLKAVTQTAPLLGFYGTVSGMIKAFESMGLRGLADTSSMALGISEALITTAAGLVIAIPVAFAVSLFVGRIGRFVQDLQEISMRFLAALEEVEEKQARRLARDEIGGDYLEV